MAEYFHQVVGPIVLDEQETAQLIRMSGGRVLALTFGGEVRLNGHISPWAIPILAQMRGLNADAHGGVLVWGASEQ